MEHKQYSLKKSRYIIIALIFVALAVASATLLINRHRTDALKPKQASPASATTNSLFSFNAGEAPGWRQGPSNNTSLALFSNDRSCFVSVEHKAGTASDTSRQQTIDGLTTSGYTVTTGEILALKQQTTSGPKQYQLHQYTVTGTGDAGQLYGGQGFGSVQLSDGYIAVQAYCNTAEQLSTAIPALQAITFDAEK